MCQSHFSIFNDARADVWDIFAPPSAVHVLNDFRAVCVASRLVRSGVFLRVLYELLRFGLVGVCQCFHVLMW